jgi:hypothetical protein
MIKKANKIYLYFSRNNIIELNDKLILNMVEKRIG